MYRIFDIQNKKDIEKMKDFFSRLDKYMKYKGLNDNKVTVQAGISNGLIGKARKRGGLSGENISKILHAFDDLNANWLFGNEGKMINENDIMAAEPSADYGLNRELLLVIESQKENILSQKEIIVNQKELISEMRAQIDTIKAEDNTKRRAV